MRLALAIAIAALGAVPAAAQQAGDRYGYGPRPKPAALASAQSLESQGFRPLTWASRTQAPSSGAAPAVATAAQGGAIPAAPGRDLPPPPRARPVAYASNAYQPFQPQAPYHQAAAPAPVSPPAAPIAPPARKPARAALPASLHDTPARGPELLGGPTSVAPVPAAPRQVAQAAGHGDQVRYYSVHRGYGLTPDAIPEPPADKGYVLIGPPDGARAPDRPADQDDDEAPGKTDRPF